MSKSDWIETQMRRDEEETIKAHQEYILTHQRESERLMSLARQAATFIPWNNVHTGQFRMDHNASAVEVNREMALQSLREAIRHFTYAHERSLTVDNYISTSRFFKDDPNYQNLGSNSQALLISARDTLKAFPPLDLSRLVGSTSYYQARAKDFSDRNGHNLPIPYYLDYGLKYEQRFISLRDKLSPNGREWVRQTHYRLQRFIEEFREREPRNFVALERNEARFREFAFATHPKAYVESGLCDLDFSDKLLIGSEPDLADTIFSEEGRSQIMATAGACVDRYAEWFNDWLRRTRESVQPPVPRVLQNNTSTPVPARQPTTTPASSGGNDGSRGMNGWEIAGTAALGVALFIGGLFGGRRAASEKTEGPGFKF